MAVKIRLARMGAKKKPIYRILVADVHFPRDGRFIERVGWYDPRATTGGLKVNAERIRYWLDKGATPTNKVRTLLLRAKKDGLLATPPAAEQPAEPVAEQPTEPATEQS